MRCRISVYKDATSFANRCNIIIIVLSHMSGAMLIMVSHISHGLVQYCAVDDPNYANPANRDSHGTGRAVACCIQLVTFMFNVSSHH